MTSSREMLAAQKLAVVTVASDDFVPGALVMFDSFLAQHPWFDGEFIIIHDGLSTANVDLVKGAFPRVVLQHLSSDLLALSRHIAGQAGWKGQKYLQFALLQAFVLQGYDRLVLCDSDLLFVKNIEPMLCAPGRIIACGDGVYYRGNYRRIEDFVETEHLGDTPVLAQTFNSGLIVVDGNLAGQERFGKLLDIMEMVEWANEATGHTDQMILNKSFGDEVVIAPVENNYLLSHRKIIKETTGLSIDDARVLHFTGRQKPWLPLFELASDMDPDYFVAMRLWRCRFAELSKRLRLDEASI